MTGIQQPKQPFTAHLLLESANNAQPMPSFNQGLYKHYALYLRIGYVSSPAKYDKCHAVIRVGTPLKGSSLEEVLDYLSWGCALCAAVRQFNAFLPTAC